VLTNRIAVWNKAIEIFDHVHQNVGRIAQNEMDLDLEMRRIELDAIVKIEQLTKEYRELIRAGLKYKDAE
jgi:hypothetical protein